MVAICRIGLAFRSRAGSGSCRSGRATVARGRLPAAGRCCSDPRVLVRGGHVHAVVLADAHARQVPAIVVGLHDAWPRRRAVRSGLALRLVGRVVVSPGSPPRSPGSSDTPPGRPGNSVVSHSSVIACTAHTSLTYSIADRGRARLVRPCARRRRLRPPPVLSATTFSGTYMSSVVRPERRAPARRCRRDPGPSGRPSCRYGPLTMFGMSAHAEPDPSVTTTAWLLSARSTSLPW